MKVYNKVASKSCSCSGSGCGHLMTSQPKRIANAAILKLIKISENCQSNFTSNYSKFLSSSLTERKIQRNFTPTILKIRALCSPNLYTTYDRSKFNHTIIDVYIYASREG